MSVLSTHPQFIAFDGSRGSGDDCIPRKILSRPSVNPMAGGFNSEALIVVNACAGTVLQSDQQ